MMGQIIDFFIIAVCLYFAIRGFFLGFISVMFSLLAYIISYFSAIFFSPILIKFLKKLVEFNEIFIALVAYVTVFLLSYIIIKLIEVQIARLTNMSILSELNRVSGILLGVMQGIVVVLLLNFLLASQPLFDFSSYLNSSKMLVYFRDIFNHIHRFIIDNIVN